jgi:hypothetical protein
VLESRANAMLSPPRLRDPLATFASSDDRIVPAEDALEGADSGPASDVRAIDPEARRLVLDTGLRGEPAQAAWLTVSALDGLLLFEGPVSESGCIEVSFDAAPGVDRVRVLLETPRGHRLAEVPVGKGWTVHSFA